MKGLPTRLSADEWKALAYKQDARIIELDALCREALDGWDAASSKPDDELRIESIRDRLTGKG